MSWIADRLGDFQAHEMDCRGVFKIVASSDDSEGQTARNTAITSKQGLAAKDRVVSGGTISEGQAIEWISVRLFSERTRISQ